jgi:hypothetical protein
MVDEHEWDEKAMLNIIVVEVDPENDEDEGAVNGSTTASAPTGADQITSIGVAPEPQQRRGLAWQAWLQRSLGDNAHHVPVGGLGRVTEANMTLARRISNFLMI